MEYLITQENEHAFHRRLLANIKHVEVYEDRNRQKKARDIIPITQLENEAKVKVELLAQHETDTSSSKPKLDFNDCLLLALMNWFRDSFFKWVDAPACRECGGKPKFQGYVEPTAEDLRFMGYRVENFKCPLCQTCTQFVRYNDPGKLLETRKGRCGEFANCFTLCCRAMNFEVRYVLDWTDHVWTEVYSESQQRWLHCDTGEDSFDKPLLYEIGWGKKLTYIIAFSVDDVEDVTWRYTTNFNEILKRRKACRENWLVRTLYDLDKQKWSSMPEEKRNIRLKRKIVELVEFMTPKKVEGKKLSGRITGSIAWRLARGEFREHQQETAEVISQYVFKLTEGEKSKRNFHVAYCCTSDKYVRLSDNGKTVTGYDALLNKSHNVLRKLDYDNNMVYIACKSSTDVAELVWKFDFTDSNLVIDSIEVKADYVVHNECKNSWFISSDNTCIVLTGGSKFQTVDELKGQTGFTIKATLPGGQKNVTDPCTQFIKQPSHLSSSGDYPFEILVRF